MDSFTFLLALLIMMFAIQGGQNWIVIAVLGVLIVTMRSITATITLVIAALAIYFVAKSGDLFAYWPLLVFGLIILALMLGMTSEGGAPEAYSPDMGGYGDLLGGGGGGYGGGGSLGV